MLRNLRTGICGRYLAGHRHQHADLVFPPMAVTRFLFVAFLVLKARSMGLRLVLRGRCRGIAAVEDLQPPPVHLDNRQVHRLIDGRANLLHQREGEIRLDFSIPLSHPLLTDALGDALDLLLLNRQPGHHCESFAALAEGWVLGPRVDDHLVHGRTVIAAVNPQRLALREKKLPDIWSSTASARPSGRCPRG